MDDVDSISDTVESAFSTGGVHVVVVPVDHSENTRVLIDESGSR